MSSANVVSSKLSKESVTDLTKYKYVLFSCVVFNNSQSFWTHLRNVYTTCLFKLDTINDYTGT